jgi:hypothetical protein
MLVGYARTSSLSQVAGLEAQERELRAAGCDKIFAEQVSSVAQREQLELALDYVREGDTFIVTKLDRLARVRCTNSQRVQTLKADSRAGIAAYRAEWEWPVQQDKPDLSLLAQTKVPQELPREQELEPVLQTDIHRTVRVVELPDGTVVEAVYDEGTIAADDAR